MAHVRLVMTTMQKNKLSLVLQLDQFIKANGIPVETVAHALGVHPATVLGWLTRLHLPRGRNVAAIGHLIAGGLSATQVSTLRTILGENAATYLELWQSVKDGPAADLQAFRELFGEEATERLLATK